MQGACHRLERLAALRFAEVGVFRAYRAKPTHCVEKTMQRGYVMKSIKIGERSFSVESVAVYKGYELNTAKGSAKDGQLFTIGRFMNLPAEGKAGSKSPNKALKVLSVSDASQVLDQLITESKNKKPTATAIARAEKTLMRARGF
jgi:hypothetical protein